MTGDHVLDDDPARIDLDVVWAWRVVGAHRADGGGMVGFARAVSDGLQLAYLADVFALPGHRGQGLGRALVATMVDGGAGGAVPGEAVDEREVPVQRVRQVGL